jgi:GDSL-like lipase/acylhydrolase family protein
MLRSPRILPLLATLAATLTIGVAGASAADWAGLGDSYAAGPLIPNQQLSPLGCLRSDHNFAHLAAAQLGQSLADASCSGATTEDMTAPQDVTPGPANPPQFDALTPTTKTVTLQIGGNDIGFTEIIENCASPTPFGHPCRDKYVVNGDDTLRDRIAAAAPKVAAVIQGIHTRSPNARVLVVNYAAILPDSGSGCWPVVPIAPGDVSYLRGIEKALNGMLADQAGANDATLVDDYTASIGHDACKSTLVKWVEPLVPTNPAAPFHPNARGEAGVAKVVAAAVAG